MPPVQPTLIAINAVIAERADDFEDWLRIVVVPAVREHRPELQGRWEALRATGQENGTVTFVFIFHGGDASQWNLEALPNQALGVEGAQRVMTDMSGMMKRSSTTGPSLPSSCEAWAPPSRPGHVFPAAGNPPASWSA